MELDRFSLSYPALAARPLWRSKASRQGIISVNWPGVIRLMMPPQVQLHFDELLRAGWLPISIVGDPGTHGAGVTGTHGIGVSTPPAAAVAAATIGFAKLLHRPNGGMLTIGVWSMIVAAVSALDEVRWVGSALSAEGVAPKEHVMRALVVTCKAIAAASSRIQA